MKIADFRVQTTVPDAPGAGVVGVYADASGRLVAKGSDSILRGVGLFFTGSVQNNGIATGGAVGLGTGVVFTNDTNTVQTGLGNPAKWFTVTGPDNVTY